MPIYTKFHILEIMSFLVNNLHEKHVTEIQDGQNFGSACTLFVIFTCVTTLHSCYMKNALFSANQTHIIFSCIIIIDKKKNKSPCLKVLISGAIVMYEY